MTPEQRKRILDLGTDGVVMCIDLFAEESREAIADLSGMSEDVRIALTLYGDKAPDGYLLVLYTTGSERMSVAVSARQNLRRALKLFFDRARQRGGNTFSFMTIPPDQSVLAIVAEFTATDGSA